MERWQSQVYCIGLENRQGRNAPHGFESHPLLHGVLLKWLRGLFAKQLAPKGGRGSNPLHSVMWA